MGLETVKRPGSFIECQIRLIQSRGTDTTLCMYSIYRPILITYDNFIQNRQTGSVQRFTWQQALQALYLQRQQVIGRLKKNVKRFKHRMQCFSINLVTMGLLGVVSARRRWWSCQISLASFLKVTTSKKITSVYIMYYSALSATCTCFDCVVTLDRALYQLSSNFVWYDGLFDRWHKRGQKMQCWLQHH